MFNTYLELSYDTIRTQLAEIMARPVPAPGKRQVPFNAVELLLCYGLFTICNPHRYGGANIDTVPSAVKDLAAFFRRTPGSLTNKMLNLDGSRPHSARIEPLLFATLAADPTLYRALYLRILVTAREQQLGEETVPDFLGSLDSPHEAEELLGQEDIPATSTILLADMHEELHQIEQVFSLSERLTEKLAERKVRLAQHYFAKAVLENYAYRCAFCGFECRALASKSQLLRASHIKPWAVSTGAERVDVRNGLAACPLHDAAFDQGYLTVNDDLRIIRAHLLQESMIKDYRARNYFGDVLFETIAVIETTKEPKPDYLRFHREQIFKG